ncbi:SAM hydrolase/SAM-dependent halogenase family protein [Methylogaea oryzae]|uniref:SAM-dependent chlorinase/fluorinase n=1 Tax=Methylogaea oryzae TaxID=1295382 RepID=A0A8D5AHE1_9GAMM|nr:SAM-dependent chlorinase/fluorinase [Methylogaea oryzae]BBL71383.1 hypothetical protein MoryE10_19890 [Methylogaea oryzae]
MIFLFTDYGCQGPYLGQLEAALRLEAPGADVINLLSDAPVADPLHASYLLAALSRQLPPRGVFLGVVDPGVGGDRLPVVLQADGRWFVGPDNGLLNTVAVQAEQVRWWRIDWRPARLSASFHGRDLFAPVAARLAKGTADVDLTEYGGPDLSRWPTDLAAVVYIDHYGNAITGWRHGPESDGKSLLAAGRRIPQADTFCRVAEGEAFWYRNSCGLVEIAVNRGRAAEVLGLQIGAEFRFSDPGA